jgi:hypothetical protein
MAPTRLAFNERRSAPLSGRYADPARVGLFPYSCAHIRGSPAPCGLERGQRLSPAAAGGLECMLEPRPDVSRAVMLRFDWTGSAVVGRFRVAKCAAIVG